jgi:oligo-1,6-glucosidase
VLWLSPVYKSPNYDNGYDISDYRDIMSEFGTMADFDRLLAEAHKRGLKIVMDLVVNHTSSEHAWFVESRKSRDNPYRDYYIWKDPGRKQGEASSLPTTPPNNWGACFGGSAWQYDEATGQYYLHLFAVQQPDLNWENDKVRREVYDMMKWWCDKGVDGFRMDVVSMFSKDQRFPDGKKNGGLYGDFSPFACNGPRIHEFLQEMNGKVLSKYDIMTVGEAANVTIDEAKKYANSGNTELGMVFQFEHVGIGDGKYGKWTTNRYKLSDLRNVLTKWQTELLGVAWNSMYWGNHDQPRSVSRWGNDNSEYRALSAKLLATVEFLLQGTPYIYQGEELGMTNVYFDKLNDYRDVEVFGSHKDLVKSGLMTEEDFLAGAAARSRDNARTPMHWNDSPNAGFTSGTPWIKVNPNYTEINAAKQVKDSNSVYSYYKQLIALRKTHAVMVYGEYTLLDTESESVWAFKRVLDGKEALCVANFSDENAVSPVSLPETAPLIGNYDKRAGNTLRPWEVVVYLK